jgi:hypothetical protein
MSAWKKLWIAVLSLLFVLFLLLFAAGIPFITPARIDPGDVAAITYMPVDASFCQDDGGPYPVPDEERDFLLELIGGAWRKPFFSDDYKPTYGGSYPVYQCFEISTNEADTYRLLFYRHKQWSLFRGETEYKLALELEEEDGTTRIWKLPHRACYALRIWWRGVLDEMRPPAA